MKSEPKEKKPINSEFGKPELAVVLSVAGVIIALLIVCVVILFIQMKA